MARTLIVEPRGELANRLRVILTAMKLAEESGRELQLWWTYASGKMNTPWHDLFEYPIPLVNGAPDGAKVIWHRGYPGKPLDTVDVDADDDCICVRTCYPLHKTRNGGLVHRYGLWRGRWEEEFYELTCKAGHYFERLRPHPAVLAIANKHDVSNRVGIHIRRKQSHQENVKYSYPPIELFLERMRQGEDDFFLATNNKDVRRTMNEQFPGRVIWHPTSPPYHATPKASRNALIDFLLLSRTKRIMGTHISSFGPTAAAIGGIPLEVLGP